jgi:hypothetical protein
VTALLALALAAAPGCPGALLAADRAATPEALAASAPGIVARLDRDGAGGPSLALAAEADALVAAAEAAPDGLRLAADRFRARLRRHCDLARAPAATGAATPAERAALDGILARPEFGRARADPFALSRWLYGLWRTLADLLGTAEAGKYATGGRTLFLAAVALALGAALLVHLRRRRAARPASAPARDAAGAMALPPPDEGDALAEAALASGRTAEAVRQSFLALLASLERSGRVPRGRTLTNLEMAAVLGSRRPPRAFPAPASAPLLPAAATDDLPSGFAALASLFDRVVYGGAPVGAEEARSCLGRSRSLRGRVDGGGA